ncbi:hypothetical protein CSUI_007577 [Cystoisospora suis]|uniref:Transmembrane protein n=1 Tax=Cystoisospora suis TaxID=483139 RepID=A0A2C6KNB0_9APIC|nr:hypothetical protein CSUI_007577 [Cystoisospora suis]
MKKKMITPGTMVLAAKVQERGRRRRERERSFDSTVPTRGTERNGFACCLEMMKKITESSFSYLFLSLSFLLSLSLSFLSLFIFNHFKSKEGRNKRENIFHGMAPVSGVSPRSLMTKQEKEGGEQGLKTHSFDFEQIDFENRSRFTSRSLSSSFSFDRSSSFLSFRFPPPVPCMLFSFLLLSSVYLFTRPLPYLGVHTPHRTSSSSSSSSHFLSSSSFPSLVSLSFSLEFAEAIDSESHSRSSRAPRRSDESSSSSFSRVKERYLEEEEESVVREGEDGDGSYHSTLPTSFMNFSPDGKKEDDETVPPPPSLEDGHREKEALNERKSKKNKENKKSDSEKNEKAGTVEDPPIVSIIRQGRDLDNLMRSSRRRREREKQRRSFSLNRPLLLHSQEEEEKKGKKRSFSLSSLFQWTGWNNRQNQNPTTTATLAMKRFDEKKLKLKSGETDQRGGEEEGDRRFHHTSPGRGRGGGGGKGVMLDPPPDIGGVLSYKAFSRGGGEDDDDDDARHKDRTKKRKKGRSPSAMNDVGSSSEDRRRLPLHFQMRGKSSKSDVQKEKNLHRRKLSGLKRGFQKKAGDLAGYARQNSLRLKSILKSIVTAILVILVLRYVFFKKRKPHGSFSSGRGDGGGGGEESSRDRRREATTQGENDAKGRKRILSLTDVHSDNATSHASSGTSSRGSRFLGRGFLRGMKEGGAEKKEGKTKGGEAAVQDEEEQKKQPELAEMLKMRLDSLKKFQGSNSSSLTSGGAHSHSGNSSSSSTGGVGGGGAGNLTSKHLYREGKKIRDDIEDLYSLLQELRKSNNELERQLLYANEFPHQGSPTDTTPEAASASGPAASTSSYVPNLGIASLLSSLFSSSSSSSPQPLPLDEVAGAAGGGGGSSATLSSSSSPPGVHTAQGLSGGSPVASFFSGGGTSPHGQLPPNASSRIATERKVMEAETQKQKALAEKAMMKNRLENTEAEVALLLERLRIAEGKISVEHEASESLKTSNEALTQKVQIAKEAFKNLKIEHEVLKQYARDLTSYSDYLQKSQGDGKFSSS